MTNNPAPKGERKEKELKFIIGQKEDGWFTPRLWIDGEQIGFTQGRTESETLDKVADYFKCSLNIRCPWYDRWYVSIKRFLNLP